MKLACELNDFFLRNLEISGANPISAAEISMNCGFDYDLFCNDQDCNKIRMVLRVVLGPDKNEKTQSCPFEIKATIEGFFTFPEDLADKQMAYLVRVNTATILYGILRGQIATITGAFPAGKFTLPTVMMQDVVKEIEERKVKEA